MYQYMTPLNFSQKVVKGFRGLESYGPLYDTFMKLLRLFGLESYSPHLL